MSSDIITAKHQDTNFVEKELWQGKSEFYKPDSKKLGIMIFSLIVFIIGVFYYVAIMKNFLAYTVLVPLIFVLAMAIVDECLISKARYRRYKYMVTNKRVCILLGNKQIDNILFSELNDIVLDLNSKDKTASVLFINKKNNPTVFLNITDYATVYNLCRQIKG